VKLTATSVPFILTLEILGSCELRTVTVNEHVLVFPLESFARQVTGVTPTEKVEPFAGVQVTGTGPSQVSIPIGVVQVTDTPPPAVACVMFAGHPVSTGGDVSLTVRVAIELVVLTLPLISTT
jgi:hypothetical protein